MAHDVTELMTHLGHDRFAAVGHDRGAYVALRLALDNPDAITHLVVLDAIPIGEALRRADATFAEKWWHWFFYAQPDKPERAILADPDLWYQGRRESMGDENFADYYRAIHDPATVHAMLEDYRAGISVDRAADDADASVGRTVRCPTLLLWSAYDDLGELYGDPLAIWRSWAPDLRGHELASGHHMAEEIPDSLAEEIAMFVGPGGENSTGGRQSG
jgi:haloacetate dehalogenase